jgi:hypothetical protein
LMQTRPVIIEDWRKHSFDSRLKLKTNLTLQTDSDLYEKANKFNELISHPSLQVATSGSSYWNFD